MRKYIRKSSQFPAKNRPSINSLTHNLFPFDAPVDRRFVWCLFTYIVKDAVHLTTALKHL